MLIIVSVMQDFQHFMSYFNKTYSVVQIRSDRFGEICKFRSRGSLALLSLGVGIDQ